MHINFIGGKLLSIHNFNAAAWTSGLQNYQVDVIRKDDLQCPFSAVSTLPLQHSAIGEGKRDKEIDIIIAEVYNCINIKRVFQNE